MSDHEENRQSNQVQEDKDEERKERNDQSNQENDQGKLTFIKNSTIILKLLSQSGAAESRLSQRTLSEDRFSKDSAIMQVCKERKKESFNQLKVWDDKRTDFLKTHKTIIDSILYKIEKRMKMSQDSMSQIVKFFKERRDQEQSYSKLFSTKVPHVSQCWKEVSDPQNQQEKSQQLSQAQQEWQNGYLIQIQHNIK